jgi:hypothetical protein
MLVEQPSMGVAYVSGPVACLAVKPVGKPDAGNRLVRFVENERKISALAAAALLLSSLSLGGCGTSTAGSSLMDARAEAAAPPKTSVYLPVEDLPPKREKPAMTPDERLKLQKELIAARDRQAPAAKARGGAARAQPVKP